MTNTPLTTGHSVHSAAHQAGSTRNLRELWGAVVLQAKEDIECTPLGSTDYTQAVAFFIGGGEWAETRTTIGDFLDLHRDEIEALGRGCINQRRAQERLPPLTPGQTAQSRAATSRFAPLSSIREPLRQPGPPSGTSVPGVSQRNRQTPSNVNPFFPRGIFA